MKFKGSLSIARRIVMLCGLFLMLSGCATMFASSHDEVTIKSDPEGAAVYDGANLLGKTPLTHSFKRDAFQQKVLTLRMNGRKKQELTLGRTLETVSLWNFGYFLTTMGGTCWLVDASSGNMIKYAPNSYLIEMEKDGTTGNSGKQTYLQRLRFVVINHADLSLDIARGDGDYLRAYFQMLALEQPGYDYPTFRSTVLMQSRYLLAAKDPLDFFYELEKVPT